MKQLQTLTTAFFRMELHPTDVSLFQQAQPWLIVSVETAAGRDFFWSAHHAVGIGKIKQLPVWGNSTQQTGVTNTGFDAVPAEVRNLVQARIGRTDAKTAVIRQQAKAGMLWGFLTGPGEELETKADPEGGQPILDEPNYLVPKAAAAQAVDRWAEMADTGKDERVHGLKSIWRRGKKSLSAYSMEGGLKRRDIPCPVVNNGNARTQSI